MFRLTLLTVCLIGLSSWCVAQDDRTTIKKSLIPASGSDTRNFIPQGWKLEEQKAADLDGDGNSDYVLKLIEDKPAKTADDMLNDRARALIVLLSDAKGKLTRAAVADKLLQCTGCGGAFYGFVEAPAEVELDAKGVISVSQEHGSREVSNTTYKFRYDPAVKRFVLIGFDYVENDRATAKVVSESTNYLTGVRKTNNRTATITKTKIFLDDVDYEKFEEAAVKRLGLD
ncbi:MAG TPA: hypothetical protein VHQ64_19865 [Pyrinomonadaceae bacterium]|nr:hypothetical protein [Pyrinomonadaceae bacterium]